MGQPADVYNAFRRRVFPAIHGLLDALFGGYALSDTPPEEYVGTLHCPQAEVEELLSAVGFTRNVVASLKVRVDGNVSDGSWVQRESLLADYQLHVILHRTETGIETYAHWEYSSIRHPYRHYLARDYSASKGVRLLRTVLEETASSYDIRWTIESSYRRRTWYISLLRMVSKDLVKRIVDVRDRFSGGLTEETSGIVHSISSALRR